MKLRRPSVAWITSIAIHLVIAVIFVQAIVMRHPFFMLFGRPSPPAVVEHIGFLVLPHQSPKSARPPTPGRSGGDGLSKKANAVPMPQAPLTVPTEIKPPAPGPATTSTTPSTGPLIGGGGPLRGIQPRYEDPRVWASPDRVSSAPKTVAQRLDSLVVGDIAAFNDSVARAHGGRAPGDWTFQKGGQKYGIDSKYIRLGPVSIPTAILALLPLNVTGNPTTYERNKTLNSRHDEIFEQAQRGINDADFDKAVKSIRQRKERERREAEAARKAAEDDASHR
jgi:hypothetical protein